MIIRGLKKEDMEQVENIFRMYWTDKEFLAELSEKLQAYVEHREEYYSQTYRFYVAEEDSEIVGVAGIRKAPGYLQVCATTNNPAEFYILAAKYKSKGIGESLRRKRVEEARNLGFTEILFYSPESHKNSWGFHDRLGFERYGTITDPDGYPGMVWRKRIEQ